jgi:hypothetical protein
MSARLLSVAAAVSTLMLVTILNFGPFFSVWQNYLDQPPRLFLYLMALGDLKSSVENLSALIHIGLPHVLHN